MIAATYDAGALIAAERGDPELWSLHARLLEHGRRPLVPAGVLGQVWRGGPQTQLSRLLRGCDVAPLTERVARAAGAALAASGTSDVIDATVVVSAAGRRVVVTSDRDDLQRVADAVGHEFLWEAV